MTTLRDILVDLVNEVRSEDTNKEIVNRYKANHVNPELTTDQEIIDESEETEEVINEKIEEYLELITKRLIGR